MPLPRPISYAFPDESAPHAHTGAWVASVLRTSIADGQLAPGTKLSEQRLAEELKVSRNTLREAFTVLAGELIVTRLPNRGVFVTSPDAEQIREIYRVRRLLEPAAILWGTRLDVPALEGVVETAHRARNEGDIAAMASANQRFHEQLIRATESSQVERLMTQVLAQMRLVFHAMHRAPDFHSHYVDANIALVQLLREGQRSAAADELRTYLDRAEAELLAHLEADGD
ncbi:GntR family transcriptional regulator [Zhihengliuella halotolerans]|uniref:DNA-binding GntR family transcriptional regulator n=1 Tax=Zhihengliuella halotolerans TaxID=370736 RepID=A0A4Q8AGR2_9MICC|nr:GntR family transcriptional regulator [Zhihengliuella halotolerans]RZU63051.1 DNA-binding GntR family transcriptional regulator [Zhihengliuella halotolerans]